MDTLNNIWSNYTTEFSFAQKLAVGVILGIIFSIAILAVILLILDVTQ